MLTANELSYLRSTKIGLLAALCFPTCDAPQLRILTDFITAAIFSGIRECTPGYSSGLDLKKNEPLEEEKPQSAVDILRNHEPFNHILSDRLIRLISKASPSWNLRFTSSVQSFQASREQFMLNQSMPSVEDYMKMRRELHGSSMGLNIAELLEIFQIPELQGAGADALENLKRSAFDVIACSMDVISYRFDQSRGVTQNLVAILMLQKNISVQGAMNLCGDMIKDAFTSFSSFEHALVGLFDRERSLKVPIMSWVWNSLVPDTMSTEEAAAILGIVKQYIQALKDCIIGSIHWAYETELFFGRRGPEIRTFGWVFADQIPLFSG